MWLFGQSQKKEEPATATAEPVMQEVAPKAIQAPTVLPQGLNPAQLHPMANLGSGIQYLDLESNSHKATGLIASRGWTEDLSYGTGAMYLMSLGVGGSYGVIEGMRKTTENTPVKLRVNTVLNSVTRRGPFLANTAGVVTILYNVVGGIIDNVRGGERDDAGTLAAGAITGAIFRAGRGVRSAALSALIGTGIAGAWAVVKHAAAPKDE